MDQASGAWELLGLRCQAPVDDAEDGAQPRGKRVDWLERGPITQRTGRRPLLPRGTGAHGVAGRALLRGLAGRASLRGLAGRALLRGLAGRALLRGLAGAPTASVSAAAAG